MITLWDPESNTLLHEFANTVGRRPIHGIAFLGRSSMLLTWTDSDMTVWNLLTMTLWWSWKVTVQSFAVETSPTDNDAVRFVITTRWQRRDLPSDVNSSRKTTRTATQSTAAIDSSAASADVVNMDENTQSDKHSSKDSPNDGKITERV
jgi:NET1-associated nuclear protein 1 (U3 small nucleolar RNA-associated protein 17)